MSDAASEIAAMVDVSVAPPAQPVGFWRRAAARVIDTALHFIVGLVAGIAAALVVMIVTAVTGQPAEPEIARISGNSVGSFVAAFLGATVMHVVAEGLHGSTLGKRICGLRVLAEDGSAASPIAALKREVAFFVDALFFGMVAAQSMDQSPLCQRVGDKWARTIVVRLATIPPRARRSEWRFLAAALGGLVADALFIFADLMIKLV